MKDEVKIDLSLFKNTKCCSNCTYFLYWGLHTGICEISLDLSAKSNSAGKYCKKFKQRKEENDKINN